MLKETFYIFNQNLVKIFLLSLAVVLPVSYLIQSFVIYFLTADYLMTPNLYSICMVLINFTILFPPFVVVAKNYLNDEEYSIKDSLQSFLDNFFLILIVTIIAFIIMVVGSPLILIPTLISLSFLIVFPLFATDDIPLINKIKNAWSVMKNENIGLLGDLILVISINILLWFLLTLFVDKMENSLIVYLTLKVLIFTIFSPLIYIYLAVKYHKSNTTI
ncbi:hypothetical protein [Rossellomorea sp. NPDC077527]|uniref:hypothetical protein n=1 Tax=Rossellomorea sp. NPDC077527 TaxID=3364510 RepID=UPI0037CC293E